MYTVQEAAEAFTLNIVSDKRFNTQTISKKKVEDACLPRSPSRTFKKLAYRGLNAKGKLLSREQTLPELKKETLSYVDVKSKFEDKFVDRKKVRILLLKIKFVTGSLTWRLIAQTLSSFADFRN
jgi:hypothetical protein